MDDDQKQNDEDKDNPIQSTNIAVQGERGSRRRIILRLNTHRTAKYPEHGTRCTGHVALWLKPAYLRKCPSFHMQSLNHAVEVGR